MNILYIVSGLSSRGGIESFCRNIIENIDLNEYQIDFLVTDTQVGDEEKFYENLGCTIYHIDGSGNFFQRAKKKKAFFKNCAKKYEIVHIHTVLTTAYLFAKLADKYLKAKVVVHSHTANNYKGTKWKNFLCRALLNKYSQHKVACSKNAGEFLFGKTKCDNVEIVHNPIDIKRFSFNQKDREEKRKDLGIDKETFVVLIVGRMVEAKNYSFLLEVFKDFSLSHKTKLLICGEGEERVSIERYIENNNFKKEVLLLGNVQDVEKWMSCADCFVLPSKYEGLPTVLVEAQVNGLPVLYSDKITKEVIFDEKAKELSIEDKTAWMIELCFIAEKKQERQELEEKFLKRGEKHFGAHNIARQLEQYYEKVTKEPVQSQAIKKQDEWKLYLFSFLNLFFLFRLEFAFFPHILKVVSVIGIFIGIFKYRLTKDFHFLILIMLILVTALWAVIVLLINNSTDYSYWTMLVALLYKIGLGVFSWFTFSIFFQEKATLKRYASSIVVTCLFLLVSTVILLLIPSFSDFWIGSVVSRNPLLDEGYFYRKSILGYTGFDEATVYSISFFCAAYLLVDKVNKNEKIHWLLIAYCVLMCGSLLYARVTLSSALISMIFAFAIVQDKKKFMNIFSHILLGIFAAFTLAFFISQGNDAVRLWFNWAVQPIVALFSGDGDGFGSLGSLINMIRMPSLRTFIIGDGYYILPSGYYMQTDIGYLRAIYYFGIFGTLLNYAIVVYLAYMICRSCKWEKSIALLMSAVLLNMILLEFKGVMWDGIIGYLIVFYFAVTQKGFVGKKKGEKDES